MSNRKPRRPPDAEHLSPRPMRQRSTAADLRRREAESRGFTPSGQLEAWLCAVVWLHAAGLPAAVPQFPAAWCRRRGVRPDWTTTQEAA